MGRWNNLSDASPPSHGHVAAHTAAPLPRPTATASAEVNTPHRRRRRSVRPLHHLPHVRLPSRTASWRSPGPLSDQNIALKRVRDAFYTVRLDHDKTDLCFSSLYLNGTREADFICTFFFLLFVRINISLHPLTKIKSYSAIHHPHTSLGLNILPTLLKYFLLIARNDA